MKRCGEVGTCHDRASAAARRSWPLRWGDGAVVVVERGPCEGEAAAAGAIGHGPCVEGDVVVANQRRRAEVLSLTKPGAAASAAATAALTRGSIAAASRAGACPQLASPRPTRTSSPSPPETATTTSFDRPVGLAYLQKILYRCRCC